jgi:hypothetical protein
LSEAGGAEARLNPEQFDHPAQRHRTGDDPVDVLAPQTGIVQRRLEGPDAEAIVVRRGLAGAAGRIIRRVIGLAHPDNRDRIGRGPQPLDVIDHRKFLRVRAIAEPRRGFKSRRDWARWTLAPSDDICRFDNHLPQGDAACRDLWLTATGFWTFPNDRPRRR